MPKSRQKSADPIQEALRSHKSEFNDATKDFISLLIGFKKGLNGRGDPKTNIPPSKIQDPLPGEVSSLLSALTSQFQSLVGVAGGIISEQNNYSKNRRKKQPKKQKIQKQEPLENPKRPGTESPVDTFLSNVASLDESIEKYAASTSLSRMWQYIKSPFSNDKKRIGLLSLVSDMRSDFLDLENAALSLDMSSIPDAIYKYQMLQYSIEALKKTLTKEVGPEDNKSIEQKESIDQKSSDKDIKAALSREEIMEALTKITIGIDMIAKSSLSFLLKDVNAISGLIDKFRNEENSSKRMRILDKIINAYQTLLIILGTHVESEVNEAKRENLKKLVLEATLNCSDIIKLSHNYITRTLKKYWLKLRGFNKTAQYRLSISNSIEIITSIVQDILNSLEETLNEELLLKQISSIEEAMKNIHKNLSILSILYRQKTYADYNKQHKSKAPGHNQMDRMFDSEIKKDIRTTLL